MIAPKTKAGRSQVKRVSRTVLGVVCVALISAAGPASAAAVVSYVFFNGPLGASPPASGSMTLTSSLLTAPDSPAFPITFTLTPDELAAAGETVLGDLTWFTFSFDGHTLTKDDITNAPSGWATVFNTFTSPFSASHVFPDGTLSLGATGTNFAAQFGAQTATGQWLVQSVTPVPLPGTVWFLLSGIGLAGGARLRRRLGS